MATQLIGQSWVSLTRDDEGHREYKLISRVESDTLPFGAFQALNTPGLPLPGAPWTFSGGDADFWARCRPNAVVTPVVSKEPNSLADVEQIFSTRPLKRCQDETIEDPLLEPADVSGGFVKYSEEAVQDRFGMPILNSAFEQIRGPQVEFDANRPTVKIKQNFVSPFLAYVLPAQMLDRVNAFPLWGFPVRCIKLSAATWQRKFHGLCSVYYERTLEFDINQATFDRTVLDEGTKALSGHWSADGRWVLDNVDGEAPRRWQPSHYMRFIDRQGNPTRVVLDGQGCPSGVRVTGRTTIIPAAPDRSGVVRLAAEAAATASRTVLALRQVRESVDTINARGTVPGMDTVLARVATASLTGTEYLRLANLASSAANGSGATAATEAANVQGALFMNQTQLAREAFTALSAIPVSEATEVVALSRRAGHLADDAVEAYRSSNAAVLAAREADAIADTGTGTFATSDIVGPGHRYFEKYHEADFLLLNIPIFF